MTRSERFKNFEKVFWQLSRKMEHRWQTIYAKTFPGSQSQIMYLIAEKGPLKMSELAASLHITAGAVTTASNLLIERGYLVRLPNEVDRRVIQLDITEKGRTEIEQLQMEGKKVLRAVFKDVSDEDFEMMYLIFERALVNIDEIS